MSDKGQQPEEMRPIPDGGLQDAMPSWLKRPPAWRSMPTAEQRHERSLPEPDTSTIDPRTLVDVTDLPQWLQSIAARGEVHVPEPDASVGHAVQQVQAARSRTAPTSVEEEPIAAEMLPADDLEITEPELAETEVRMGGEEGESPASSEPLPVTTESQASPNPAGSSSKMPMIAAGVLILAALVAVLIFFVL